MIDTNYGISLKLEEYVEAYAQRGYFNGSVLVAQDGQILLNNGYGFANFEHKVPNTKSTKFRIGSITKGFTSMAIMQFEEKGLLDVNNTINLYLPDFPNGDKITIHQLLTHTSGLGNHTITMEFWETTIRTFFPSVESIIEIFKYSPLVSEPGETFNYSNSGYILLTAIIEKVSNENYGDYIRNHILTPLEMTDTGYDDGRKVHKNLASSYSLCKAPIHPEFEDMSQGQGAYGLYSTIEDLFLWDKALYTESLIKKNTLEKIFTPYHRVYGGYGWNITEEFIAEKYVKRVGHLGDTGGFIANIHRYVEQNLVIIVLSNISITPVEQISQQLAKIVLGESLIPTKKIYPLSLKNDIVNKIVGTYTSETGVKIEITEEENNIYISMAKRYGVWYKYHINPTFVDKQKLEFVTSYIDEKGIIYYNQTSKEKQLKYIDIDGNEIDLVKLTEN